MGRHVALVAVVLFASVSGGSEIQAQPTKVKPLRRIAIAPLKNLRPGTDSDWIGAGAAETLTIKLAGLPGLITIEQIQINKVIEAQDIQNADFSDPKTAAKIGKLVGAERMLIGTYSKADKNMVFSVQVIDVETGIVLNAASIRATEANIFDALFQLADAVIKSFDKKVVIVGSRPAAVQALKVERIALTEAQVGKLKRCGTGSLDAYEAFSRGCAAKDLDDQIRWHTKASSLDPGYAFPWNSRGLSHEKKGDFNAALGDYTKAIGIDPNYAKAYANRGNVHRDNGEYDRAIRDYNTAIELEPNDASAYYDRGIVHSIKGDDEAAIGDFTKAIELSPKLALAYVSRGDAHASKGDFDAAIRDYTKVIELDPNYANAYYNRGFAHSSKDDFDAAIRDYTKGIELDPNDGGVHRSRGIEYASKGDFDAAIGDFTKAIELDPNDAGAYVSRGYAYASKGDYDAAIRDYTRGIELRPKLALAYVTRGHAYARKGEYDAAIRDYTRSIELDPDYGKAYGSRGNAHVGKGDYDAAIRDWTKAIELDPKDARAYCSRGYARARKGDYDAAIRDYTKAIELNPKDAWGYYSRGIACVGEGNYNAASRDFAKAIELKPADPYAHILLFLTQAHMGKDGKADLAKFRKTQEDDEWITPVIRMYLGEITPDQCLAAATSKDAKLDNEQKCEGYYFVGQFYLIRDKNKIAREYFEKCVATNARHFFEYSMAKAELKRVAK